MASSLVHTEVAEPAGQTSPDDNVSPQRVTRSPAVYLWAPPVLVLVLAFALRFYCLDCHSLWYDDIVSIEPAQRDLIAIFNDRFGWLHVQTPLFYALIKLFTLPVDPTVTSIFVRLPAALSGSLLAIVVYALGRELFGKRQGVIAALMCALSVQLLDFSEDVRPYSLLAFLTALSVYCLLRAERTGAPRWWLAFTGATICNLLTNYYADNLVMPALAPYFLWLLWGLWSRRAGGGRSPLYAAASMALSGAVTGLMLLDLLQLRRTPPDLSKFSLISVHGIAMQLTTFFAQFGISGWEDSILQTLFLLVALVGAYAGLRHGRARGVWLCLLLMLIPALLLAVLSTTNTVFERYALFAAPFYYLLIANGVASVLPAEGKLTSVRPLTALAFGWYALVLLPFVVGAFVFATPDGHSRLSYGGDFRGVARYLSDRAQPGDVVVFVDNPALGLTVSNFYWHDRPPVPTFDARDPRLFARSFGGSIYWVVSSLDRRLPPLLAAQGGWSGVANFDSTVVLREDGQATGLYTAMNSMVVRLERIRPDYQPIQTLRGSLLQAKGDIAQAAQTYVNAGPSLRFGEEYLKTAEGYAERGDMQRAWREAAISKFMEPYNPDIHDWLAIHLAREGYTNEASSETRIASDLRQRRAR